MAKTATKKQVQKRPYRKNLLERLQDGKPWKVILEVDNDIAKKIATELEASPAGGEYRKLINSRLRKAYGMK